LVRQMCASEVVLCHGMVDGKPRPHRVVPDVLGRACLAGTRQLRRIRIGASCRLLGRFADGAGKLGNLGPHKLLLQPHMHQIIKQSSSA
jgi:hypothetical protein